MPCLVGGGTLGEGIEDEAGQAGREDGIARRDPVDRLQQFAAGNGLGDVAAGSGTDHGDDIFGGIGHREGEKLHLGVVGQDALEDGLTAAAGEMDVEQDDVGEALVDHLDGRGHLVRLADDLDGVAQLGPDAGPEDRMVLDEEDPAAGAPRSRAGRASVMTGHRQLDFGPFARCRSDGHRATVASHAGPDGLRDALAVGGDARRDRTPGPGPVRTA